MDNEGLLRVGCFVGAALIFGFWETKRPRRNVEPGRTGRWLGNLGVVVLAAVLARLCVPIMPVLLAGLVRDHGIGLFAMMPMPGAVETIIGVVILDAAIYAQHRAFHAWPLLWRLHRMHHADIFLDFTSGVRFHPVEMLLSLAFKLALVVVFAPPPQAVLAFEIILNGAAMFNHANIFLPESMDRMLRAIVVTPDMHRVHHSVRRSEMQSNFGFNFPWWDRLFSTYKEQPDDGHQGMTLGLGMFREPRFRSLPWLLAMPFVREPANSADRA